MDLYFGRMSGNSARALFGLLESGAPFTQHVLDTRGGENKQPGYLAINPMGKVPALRDGDFSIWESNAINWYAAEKNPASGLVPDSPEGRARVHRWLFFQSSHVSPAALQIIRAGHEAMRAFYGFTADPAAVEAARKELARFLPVLDAALTGKDWLEGTFTLADVALVPHLVLMSQAGFDLKPYPALDAWLGRAVGRAAWKETARTIFGG